MYQVHESSVNHIQPSKDNRLVLTSSSWRAPYSKLWSTGEFFEEKCEYSEDEYVEFSNLNQDKVGLLENVLLNTRVQTFPL